jgi:hypothetical protein
MFTVGWTAKGIYATAKVGDSAIVARAWLSAGKQALEEYVTGRGHPALIDRFQASAFARYGFAGRTPKYQKAQMKWLGAVLPYVSPRRGSYGAVATALLKGNLSKAMHAFNRSQGGPRMRDLVRQPGIGYRITASGKRLLVLRLRLPGARALNQLGGRGEVYRQQFVDLSRGGGRDIRWITWRAGQLYGRNLKAELARQPQVRIA